VDSGDRRFVLLLGGALELVHDSVRHRDAFRLREPADVGGSEIGSSVSRLGRYAAGSTASMDKGPERQPGLRGVSVILLRHGETDWDLVRKHGWWPARP
jgi:hypothetical protein